jgi:hypothetical protein
VCSGLDNPLLNKYSCTLFVQLESIPPAETGDVQE